MDIRDCDDIEIEDVDSVGHFSDKKEIKSYECKEKGQHKLKVAKLNQKKPKKSKLSLAKFKTENMWSVFQDFTEAEIKIKHL